MKVEFEDGFKIKLIAETELERIFMGEWQRRSEIRIEDMARMQSKHINPDFIDWEFRGSEQ